ncbi:hypothetical protein AB0D54_38380, partial [Streptomyces xanthophaeus]
MIGETPRVRRVAVAAWGGAAVSWELSTPGRLAPSLATCAAFLLLATGCALHIRRLLLVPRQATFARRDARHALSPHRPKAQVRPVRV